MAKHEDRLGPRDLALLMRGQHEDGAGPCKVKGPNDSSLEMWAAPGTNVFVVQVYAGQRGWDIFTASGTIKIDETLADAEKRLGLTEEKT